MYWLLVVVVFVLLVRWAWLRCYKLTWPWQWKRIMPKDDIQFSMYNGYGVWVARDSEASLFPFFWEKTVVLKAKELIWQVAFSISYDKGAVRIVDTHICTKKVLDYKVALSVGSGDVTFFALNKKGQKVFVEAVIVTKKEVREAKIKIY